MRLPGMAFHLYILRCIDGSYYVGHTEDLAVRFAMHQSGEFGGYTSKRRPVELAYACEFATRDDAFRCERQVKGWSRAKKEALMRGDWLALSRLATRGSHKGER